MTRDGSTPPADSSHYDPVFLHSRREFFFILCVWLAALLWAVPYCATQGYVGAAGSEDLAILWGMPRWVVLGVVAPWLVADVITIIFCFVIMQDDDLGEDVSEEPVRSSPPAGETNSADPGGQR